MGKVIKVSGPLVVATGLADANMSDVVRVGPQRLIGEILTMDGDTANIQVYEETSGLGPGAEVVTTGYPMSVELGPGMIENIYDGIQRPLEGILKQTGSNNLPRGVEVPPIDPEKLWEFSPVAKAGDEVLSGCVSLTGVLRLRVTKPFSQSTVAKILDLVENASSKKAKAENFITRFARYYTPAVVIGAVALAIIPSLITGQWSVWVGRALMFLVISCPCALVISVPLSFFGGIGGASAKGVLVKGGNYLELLASTETVVFDKTGTLTRGVFELDRLLPAEGVDKDDLLETAALAESFSNHPIAQSLRRAYGKDIDEDRVTDVQEIAGHGITALVDGIHVAAGNRRLMIREGVDAPEVTDVGTLIYVARDGKYLGCAVIADQIKETAPAAIQDLKRRGIRTVMLTGDAKAVGEAVGAKLGLDQVRAQLLPEDKVTELEKLLDQKSEKGVLAYVGDGVNDAPVLSRADVGIAMGALGSDAAIEAADVVLMDDDPAKLSVAMDIARKCMRIVRENIVFALGVKAAFLILGALGKATMWAAVFADVGVAVIAILNAMRMLRNK